MGDGMTTGKSTQVGYGSKQGQENERTPDRTPGKSTLVEQSGHDTPDPLAAPVSIAQAMMQNGQPPEAIATVIEKHPQYAGAIAFFAQQMRGNAYSRKIVDLVGMDEEGHVEKKRGELTPELAMQLTGDTYGAKGAVCDNKPTGAGCFMQGGTRSRIVGELRSRIDRAYAGLLSATNDLKAELMSEHEEESGIVATIIVSAVFSEAGAALIGAVKALHAVEKAKGLLEEFGEQADSAIVRSAMKDMNEKHLEAMIGSSLDAVKEKTKGSFSPAGAAEDEKSSALNYLTMIQQEAAMSYAHMAENVPAQINDVDLMAYYESFAPQYHTAPAYAERIEKGLKMYMGSKAKEIGRTNDGKYDRETYVAGIKEQDGNIRWMYVDKLFDSQFVKGRDAPAYNGVQALSYEDQATAHRQGLGHVGGWDGIGGNDVQVKSTPVNQTPGFLGWVEPAMQEIALKRHKATWQKDPEVFDYSYFTQQGAKE